MDAPVDSIDESKEDLPTDSSASVGASCALPDEKGREDIELGKAVDKGETEVFSMMGTSKEEGVGDAIVLQRVCPFPL